MALKRPLGPHRPIPKFIAIKVIVFLCFWQEIVLVILTRFHIIREIGSWTAENVTTGIADLLVCFEMLLAALYHRYAFPWQVYDRGHDTHVSVGLDNSFALSDASRDFREILPGFNKPSTGNKPSATKSTAQNISSSIPSVTQVIIDGGDRHVHMIERDGEVDIVLEGEEPLLNSRDDEEEEEDDMEADFDEDDNEQITTETENEKGLQVV